LRSILIGGAIYIRKKASMRAFVNLYLHDEDIRYLQKRRPP